MAPTPSTLPTRAYSGTWSGRPRRSSGVSSSDTTFLLDGIAAPSALMNVVLPAAVGSIADCTRFDALARRDLDRRVSSAGEVTVGGTAWDRQPGQLDPAERFVPGRPGAACRRRSCACAAGS